jgi:hypothetical protein
VSGRPKHFSAPDREVGMKSFGGTTEVESLVMLSNET